MRDSGPRDGGKPAAVADGPLLGRCGIDRTKNKNLQEKPILQGFFDPTAADVNMKC